MRLWSTLIFFLIGLPVCCGCQQVKEHNGVTPHTVSLCEVLKSPLSFAGKIVAVDVQIFSMKEGSSISSPDCPMLRVTLVTTLEAGPESGIVSLRKEMSQYQFASRPVLAILSGVYVPDFPDDVRHRRYAVFKASAARDVRRSSHSERR